MTNDSKHITKPWVVYRCWAGQASTLVPQPTDHSFSTRESAEQFASDLTRAMSATGTWFEVRHAGDEVDPGMNDSKRGSEWGGGKDE